MPPFLLGGDIMKFQFRPNTTIVDYDKMLNICTFDESGFYETDDPKKIKYLTKRSAVKVVEESPKETQKEEKKLPTVYNCKKCDFKTENQGDLLVHYRTNHPKKPKK
jgi:hypothetical protein